jgi:hypothetical protein
VNKKFEVRERKAKRPTRPCEASVRLGLAVTSRAQRSGTGRYDELARTNGGSEVRGREGERIQGTVEVSFGLRLGSGGSGAEGDVAVGSRGLARRIGHSVGRSN